MRIETTFGGPCIYKQGFLADGSVTGRIQYIGQSEEKLNAQLLASLKTGRDDLDLFIRRVLST